MLEGAPASGVAAKTFQAADAALKRAGDDAAVRLIFYILTQLPIAARAADPAEALWELGFSAADLACPEAFCSALLVSIDTQVAQEGLRSDLAEIAALSSGEALYAFLEGRSRDLIAARPVLAALAALRTPKHFGDLTKNFLARFLDRTLGYYLSRELPMHIGAQKRFSSVREHDQFARDIAVHCTEVAEIARIYAGEWFSKAVYEEKLTRATAGNGLAYAFKKLRDELVLR